MQSEPRKASSPVWALPRSLAATYGITFVFSSSGYLDVSVHRVPGLNLWIQLRSTRVFLVRLPHSDICGSWSICLSPQLFAAYHVFHRLLVPRHPPCALHNLTCYAGISPDLSIIWILFLSFSQRYESDKAHFFRNGLDEFLHRFLMSWFWFGHRTYLWSFGSWYNLYFSIRFSRNNYLIHDLRSRSKSDCLNSHQKPEDFCFLISHHHSNFFINLAATYPPIPSPV